MNKTNINEIEINGITYVPKSTKMADSLENMPYVIVRAYLAGVFAGYLEKREGHEGIMKHARRI